MAQQIQDSFVADSFTPDSFEADSFTPDTDSEFETIEVRPGQFMSRRKGETTEQALERIGVRRNAPKMIGGLDTVFDRARERMVDAISNLPINEGSKPQFARLGSLALEIPRFIAESLSEPEGLLFPGMANSLSRFGRTPIEPTTSPLPIRRQPLALPAGRDPFIASSEGRIQRQSLLNPQEEARLSGFDVSGENIVPMETGGNLPLRGTDLAEAREAERLRNVFYTGSEQSGASRLTVPDRPNMDLPPVAGDTRLGFARSSGANLEYPLNIAPEAVRPRSAQTVTRALTGDDFAREVMPQEGVEFISPKADDILPENEVIDMRGGTRSLEPGEPILPSAPPRTRVAPHIQEQARAPIFEDKVDGYVKTNIDPVIPGASEQVAPILAQNRSTLSRLADGLFISGERQLERMGEVGNEIRRVLSQVEYRKRELFNQFAQPFMQATRRLNSSEIENFVLTMDGSATAMNPNVQAAVDQARLVTELMGDMAQRAGVRLRTPNGKVVEFKPIKEYWPHRPVNPIARSSFIDELMRRNPKLSRSSAERLARQFQSESEFFNSPQHSRMFGDFEWRKDLNSMIDHMADMSDIISRATILGPGDIGVNTTPISRLIEMAPDPARAHELVRTHLRGGLDKNDAFYQAVKAVNRFATKVQVFTKLGLFPISNLNNQLQTMLHGNFAPFVESFTKAIAGSQELKTLAKNYGTISVGDIPVGILTEAGKRQVPFVGSLVKWAEDFARTVATGTGQGTARTLFRNAKAGDRMSTKRLQNLLLQDDISDVLTQSQLSPEQLKFATQRFVELAQQLDSGMKLPPAWVNEPLLHIPLIFKRFGFQGTKSVKDAIMSNPRRNIPLFLIASPLLGELTGDLKSAIYGVVRGAPEPDGMLEAIAYELGGRHKFAERMTGLDSEASDIEFLVNRLTADMLQSWGFGLIADMLQGALGGKNAGYSALFGPAIDQAISVVSGIGQGDLTGLGREALRSIPIAGPGLQRRLLPTQAQEMP